jgi:hypothetical protein
MRGERVCILSSYHWIVLESVLQYCNDGRVTMRNYEFEHRMHSYQKQATTR